MRNKQTHGLGTLTSRSLSPYAVVSTARIVYLLLITPLSTTWACQCLPSEGCYSRSMSTKSCNAMRCNTSSPGTAISGLMRADQNIPGIQLPQVIWIIVMHGPFCNFYSPGLQAQVIQQSAAETLLASVSSIHRIGPQPWFGSYKETRTRAMSMYRKRGLLTSLLRVQAKDASTVINSANAVGLGQRHTLHSSLVRVAMCMERQTVVSRVIGYRTKETGYE